MTVRASWASSLLFAAASILAAPAPPATDEGLRVGTTHALVKVRPGDRVPGGSLVELAAARNEFESFQLVLRSTADVEEVDVEVGDLAGSEGVIPAREVTVYLAEYLTLRRASSRDGGTGDWPDPLVPRVDRYFGERRAAFPFALAGNRTRAVWIEVYVPTGTPAGRYRGQVTVTAGGKLVRSIVLRVQVWPFTLPSTASLATSFGLSGPSILQEHFGRYTSDEDLHELTRLYAKAALLHRISTHGGTMVPPRGRRAGERWNLYWDDYDREVAPFLAGTVFGDSDPLPGARATSVQVRTPVDLEPAEQIAYWRSWVDHFAQRGWLDRLFLYLWDEPRGPWKRTPFAELNLMLARLHGEPVQDYVEVAELARHARRADPRLPTAVTEQLVPAMDDVIDRWIPLINCLDAKPGYPSFCEESVGRAAYSDLGQENAPWFYQSCGSHGCDEVGGEYFSGWPSYMIDAPAVGNRIMQWLAWRYRIGGELYHNTTRAFGLGRDPWKSVYFHGGNGDGTFFYPGRPDVIGGRRHIPVESTRLKLLRDGLEDYEYLVILAGLGDRALADAIAARVAPSAYGWSADPQLLHDARHDLGERIARLASSATGSGGS